MSPASYKHAGAIFSLRTARWSRLSEETYGYIIDLSTPDCNTLAALRLVCRSFAQRSRRHWFRELRIDTHHPKNLDLWQERNEGRLKILQKEPMLLGFIKKFIVYTDSKSPKSKRTAKAQSRIVAGFMKLLESLDLSVSFIDRTPTGYKNWVTVLGITVRLLRSFLRGKKSLTIDFPLLKRLQRKALPNTFQELTVRLFDDEISTVKGAFFKSMRQNLITVTTMNIEFESGLEASHWINRSRFNEDGNEHRSLGIVLRSPIIDNDVRHVGNGVPSPFGELELVLELAAATFGHRLSITIKFEVTHCFGTDKTIYSKHFGCKCWEAVKKDLCRFSSVDLTLDYVFKNKEDRMEFDKRYLDKLFVIAKESPLRCYINNVTIISSMKSH